MIIIYIFLYISLYQYLLCIISTGISSFHDVYTACQDCAHNWEDLGSALGVKRTSIETIKKNNHGDAEGCLREVITIWLKQDSRYSIRYPSPSWRRLCEAVQSTKDLALAYEIGKQHPDIKQPVAGQSIEIILF